MKSSRRDTTITTYFKGETGCMNAIVSCKEHDHSKRDIYDICSTNESGLVRLSSAILLFCDSCDRRPPSKFTVKHTNKLLSAQRMDCYGKPAVSMPSLTSGEIPNISIPLPTRRHLIQNAIVVILNSHLRSTAFQTLRWPQTVTETVRRSGCAIAVILKPAKLVQSRWV